MIRFITLFSTDSLQASHHILTVITHPTEKSHDHNDTLYYIILHRFTPSHHITSSLSLLTQHTERNHTIIMIRFITLFSTDSLQASHHILTVITHPTEKSHDHNDTLYYIILHRFTPSITSHPHCHYSPKILREIMPLFIKRHIISSVCC